VGSFFSHFIELYGTMKMSFQPQAIRGRCGTKIIQERLPSTNWN